MFVSNPRDILMRYAQTKDDNIAFLRNHRRWLIGELGSKVKVKGYPMTWIEGPLTVLLAPTATLKTSALTTARKARARAAMKACIVFYGNMLD
jgi:hypothetical protein